MTATNLVCLPGLLCDSAVWTTQIHDLRDIAECSVADYGTLSTIAAMAESVLRSAPEQFALAGHSMGGRVALEIYRRAPERVTRLALLDTGYQARPSGEAGDKEATQRYALLDLARKNGMGALAERWTPGMVHADRLTDACLMGAISAMVERKTPAIFEAQINALLHRPDAEALLPRISCPTLVRCGREDGWSPLPRHRDMVAMIPDGRLAVIENSGHMTTMEQPQDVSAALREWLAG